MYNEILVGRWNKALNALFGIKAGAPSPSLSGDLQVSYQVDTAVDGRFLEGWSRWAASVNLTGGVGATAYLHLLNPAGSGAIAVIERIRIGVQNDAASQTVNVGKTVGAFLGGDVQVVIATHDSRQAPSQGSQGSIVQAKSNITQAGSPALQFLDTFVIGANSGTFVYDLMFTEHQETIILAGDSIVAANLTQNKAFQATMWWRERVLEDSERR
jgi:hypothetical protein